MFFLHKDSPTKNFSTSENVDIIIYSPTENFFLNNDVLQTNGRIIFIMPGLEGGSTRLAAKKGFRYCIIENDNPIVFPSYLAQIIAKINLKALVEFSQTNRSVSKQKTTISARATAAQTVPHCESAQLGIDPTLNVNVRMNSTGDQKIKFLSQFVAKEETQKHLEPLLRIGLYTAADINTSCTEGGANALHRACSLGYLQAIKTLVERGGDMEKPTKMGNTPRQLLQKKDAKIYAEYFEWEKARDKKVTANNAVSSASFSNAGVASASAATAMTPMAIAQTAQQPSLDQMTNHTAANSNVPSDSGTSNKTAASSKK